MEIDVNRWINTFTFDESASAGSGSLPADEKRMSSCCKGTGRLICNKENRESCNSGGHKDEEIKIRSSRVDCWKWG
jgi:hypothetical protein